MSLHVKPLHMRIDGETLQHWRVHELASYVGDSGLYSSLTFWYIPVVQSLIPIYLDQALLIHDVCLCVIYLHSKDTSPSPSRPSHASLSSVELGFIITLSKGT